MKTTLIGAAALASALAGALRAQDAERATHGDQAATPQVAYEFKAGDVLLRQYQLGCLSQLSYLIASGAEALVVDPERDVEHYRLAAKQIGARIKYVALTHTNADFVAGHTELAAREGAQVLISAESDSEFVHRGMHDGESMQLGALSIEFIATPGHTLDSMSLLVRVSKPEGSPQFVLTGDALFIGSIGRPDLAQGTITPSALASHAFDSVQRLRALDPATIVLPAHGAGSLCGAHLSPDTTSTIGRERDTNPFLQIKSRAAFIARDVSGLPPAPQYFAYNVALNRKGPPVVDWTNEMPAALAPDAVQREIAGGAWVVDLRDARAYAAAHVEGSVNVSVRGRLDTWTGIVIPFESRLVLVGSSDEVREAAFRFKRIGLDHVVGYLAGELEAAGKAGLILRTAELVAPVELARRIASGSEPIVVDVRTPAEHAELAIGEYANIELVDWPNFGRVLDREQPVLFLCNSAYRSSMAMGLAERLGFKHVGSLDGGLDAWLSAGLAVYGTSAVCAGPICPPNGAQATPRVSTPTAASNAAALELPEAMEPSALASALLDQPQNYTVIDVRPAWQYREYHVPGAINVAPEALAAHVLTLPKNARIVLADRDGTLAYAIAAATSSALGAQSPMLRVLGGGTARFWREIEIVGKAGADKPLAQPASAPIVNEPAKPTTPKKRSAGC